MVDESHGLPLIAASKADQGEEAHDIKRVEKDEVRDPIDNLGMQFPFGPVESSVGVGVGVAVTGMSEAPSESEMVGCWWSERS